VRYFFRLLSRGVNRVEVSANGLEEPDAEIIILDLKP